MASDEQPFAEIEHALKRAAVLTEGAITLRDLLTMSSGIRYREGGFTSPLGDDTYTYYGVDLRDVALNRVRIVGPPGVSWQYNNYHPLLLGLVLERATGMPVSEYMATRLWQPLGAEADATWSLDSEDSGFEKMESGLNATPVDYARFGLLFLHDGEWKMTGGSENATSATGRWMAAIEEFAYEASIALARVPPDRSSVSAPSYSPSPAITPSATPET
jgi:CubicO group peptidase (beta-lactamase class C family)